MEYALAINTVRRIEVDVAEQVIATAGANRVPLHRVFEHSTGIKAPYQEQTHQMTPFLFSFKMFHSN